MSATDCAVSHPAQLNVVTLPNWMKDIGLPKHCWDIGYWNTRGKELNSRERLKKTKSGIWRDELGFEDGEWVEEKGSTWYKQTRKHLWFLSHTNFDYTLLALRSRCSFKICFHVRLVVSQIWLENNYHKTSIINIYGEPICRNSNSCPIISAVYTCGSRAVRGDNVIVSRLGRGSKFKPHLKFWANRVCFGHLWALSVALGAFINNTTELINESRPNRTRTSLPPLKV